MNERFYVSRSCQERAKKGSSWKCVLDPIPGYHDHAQDGKRVDGVLGKVDEGVRVGVVYGKVNVVVSSTAFG